MDYQPHPIEDPETGDWRLNSSKCTTCLFQSGRMIPDYVAGVRDRDSYIVCHETYDNTGNTVPPGTQQSMCRGYWDAYSGTQRGLRMIADADMIEEVPPPPPPADVRPYELAWENPDTVQMRRKGA